MMALGVQWFRATMMLYDVVLSEQTKNVSAETSDWKLWWSRFLLLSSELLVPKLGDLREI